MRRVSEIIGKLWQGLHQWQQRDWGRTSFKDKKIALPSMVCAGKCAKSLHSGFFLWANRAHRYLFNLTGAKGEWGSGSL